MSWHNINWPACQQAGVFIGPWAKVHKLGYTISHVTSILKLDYYTTVNIKLKEVKPP